MTYNQISQKLTLPIIIVLISFVLGVLSTSEHVKALDITYLQEGKQLERHENILAGEAGNPWQYRVLTAYMVDVVIDVLGKLNVPYHIAISFMLFRIFQDTLIILLAYMFYKKLGLPLPHVLMGLAILAWGMSQSHHESDLQFNTFFDVTFYLLTALCILYQKFIWIIPITLFAALNRETSGLIPFLLLAVSVFTLPPKSLRKIIPIVAISLGLYIVIFVGLRFSFESQRLLVPNGNRQGFDLLLHNLVDWLTWQRLAVTLNITPIIAFLSYRKWPVQLKVFFWVIVPIWIAIHAFGSVMAETRLFLVPYALVCVPGALWSLYNPGDDPDEATSTPSLAKG